MTAFSFSDTAMMEDIQEKSMKLLDSCAKTKDLELRAEIIHSYISTMKTRSVEKKIMVPDFPPGLEWMNTIRPLSMYSNLRKKIVVLDFFTYCCINCMHVLPDLKALEKHVSVEDGLVIIGVHSAKFPNEKLSANIENAVSRYNISHAVVNDCNSEIWNAYNIMCWPSLFVIGPNGAPLLVLHGEGNAQFLKIFVHTALDIFQKNNLISTNAISELKVTTNLIQYGPLLFPGKITTTICEEHDKNMLIAISDTGHNRIIITMSTGLVQHVIGGSGTGFKDGTFDEALFSTPQGLAFKNRTYLYVADTENHAIREINLEDRYVKTVTGNGKQGSDRKGGRLWTDQPISSPWDVCFATNPNILFIAMAGLHQIWALFLNDTDFWKSQTHEKGVCVAIAGSGREENRNNLYPMSAGFAQPSGLAYCPDPPSIIIADSESSAIRRLLLNNGKVCAIAGGDTDPTNLFMYGDCEGKNSSTKFQHPLAVAWCKGNIYVADSYNHKIKKIDPSNVCSTVTKPNELNEPGGLCSMGNSLLIANTNNHCIELLDIDNSLLTQFPITIPTSLRTEAATDEKYVYMNHAGGEVLVNVTINIPSNAKITENSPSNWLVELPGHGWNARQVPELFSPDVKFEIYTNGGSVDTNHVLFIRCQLYLCVNEKCIVKKMSFLVTVCFTSAKTENPNCSFKHDIVI